VHLTLAVSRARKLKRGTSVSCRASAPVLSAVLTQVLCKRAFLCHAQDHATTYLCSSSACRGAPPPRKRFALQTCMYGTSVPHLTGPRTATPPSPACPVSWLECPHRPQYSPCLRAAWARVPPRAVRRSTDRAARARCGPARVCPWPVAPKSADLRQTAPHVDLGVIGRGLRCGRRAPPALEGADQPRGHPAARGQRATRHTLDDESSPSLCA
jgi:hypothetical protein